MRLLLDEMVPLEFSGLLSDLGHRSQHVIVLGLSGSSDEEVFTYSLPRELVVLTFNKYKNEPDREAALTAMTRGQRIVCVTARGLQRQRQAISRCIADVESRFEEQSILRRATIMNNFQVRYEHVADIRKKLHGDRIDMEP